MSDFINVSSALAQANHHHPAFKASAILSFDRTGEINTAAESVIHQAGLGNLLATWLLDNESVTLETLTSAMGEMCRQDLALGLGYCLTAFMAATNLAVAGNDEQKRTLAALLSDDRRIAIAYHELQAGNDLTAMTFKASKVEGGYLLSGCKEVVNNLARAHGLVLFADTGNDNPACRHSLFLLTQTELNQKGVSIERRFDTLGVRNCHISGIYFDRVFIADSCLIGEQGRAGEYALKAFQITRTLLPAISQFSARNGLEILTRFAQNRVLYGDNLFAIPVYRKELAEATADVWLAGEMASLLRHALQAFPQFANGYSSASKYFLPPLMKQAIKSMGSLIGARYYLMNDDFGMFEKLVRDFPVVSFGHAGSLVCQTSLVHMLPRLLAEKSQSDASSILTALNTSNTSWLSALRLSCSKSDPLLSLLPTLTARCRALFAQQAEWVSLLTDLEALKTQCFDSLQQDIYGAATRYCKLIAAISVLRNITATDSQDIHHALGFITLWRLTRPMCDPSANTYYLSAADTISHYLQDTDRKSVV